MNALVARLSALALAMSSGCVAGPGGSVSDAGTGEILVEVYSGFVADAPPLETPPVHFLVDADALRPGVAGAVVSDRERLKIRAMLLDPYVARHPGLGFESAALHLFDPAPDAGAQRCDDPAASRFAASRALGRLGDGILGTEPSARARVVIFSRFGGECVPRLCEVASAMMERGVWIDVVALDGESGLPACLATDPPPAPPAILASWMPARPPSYSVEAVTRPGQVATVFARAPTGSVVQVPAGIRRIRVSLDPPEIVGPIRVRRGERVRVRVMDFPLSAPGARSWTVETVDVGG